MVSAASSKYKVQQNTMKLENFGRNKEENREGRMFKLKTFFLMTGGAELGKSWRSYIEETVRADAQHKKKILQQKNEASIQVRVPESCCGVTAVVWCGVWRVDSIEMTYTLFLTPHPVVCYCVRHSLYRRVCGRSRSVRNNRDSWPTMPSTTVTILMLQVGHWRHCL